MKFIRVLLNVISLTGLIAYLVLLHRWPVVVINTGFSPESLLEFSLSGFVLAYCFQPKYTIKWRVMAFLIVILIVCEGLLLFK